MLSSGLRKLNLNLSPQEILDQVGKTINASKQAYLAVAQIPTDKANFNNTVQAICDDHANRFGLFSNSSFPSLVSTNPDVRKASLEAKKQIEEYQIECTMREDVYKVLQAYKSNTETNNNEKIDKEEKRVLGKLLEDFERNGLCKPDTLENLQKKKKLTSDLSLQFNRNVNEDTTLLQFSKDELQGMPDSFINNLSKNDQGQYLVSLKMPDYIAVMKKAQKEETRKKIEKEYNSRALKDNIPILLKVLSLRQEMAEILGFPNWAAYNLLPKMAATPEGVFSFLDNLHAILQEKVSTEISRLLEIKKEITQDKFDGKINSWDYSFYENILMEKEYEVEDAVVQQYFPMDKVTDGMLAIYQEILGLKFEEVKGTQAETQIWHQDVRLFGVTDAKTNQFLGNFYLDLFPRDGKYSHAACFPIQIAHTYADGTKQYTVVAMVANFTKPTSDSPSLLKHSEVKTFFHEFGHVMHAICSSSKYGRLNWTWTAVEQDFLEAPSMMLENWVWQKEVLQRISQHHKTLEPLPDDLLLKMIRAKNVDSDFSEEKLIQLWEDLKVKHTKVGHTKDTYFPASWQHLTTGYDAGYYGYLWSMVFSADMFTKFKQEGVLNKDIGMLFRQSILAPCASETGSNMLRNFLNRDPNQEAFKASIFG